MTKAQQVFEAMMIAKGVGEEIPQESERPWENQSIGMVVTGLLRHRKTAWISRRR